VEVALRRLLGQAPARADRHGGAPRALNTAGAARRWAETWAAAWPRLDAEAIAALYAAEHAYRALAFREPTTARRYLAENFAVESEVECRFGEPIVEGDRAAVEWWGTWVEAGARLTLAGSTLLRFDDDGFVVDHRDYWNEIERREEPYEGWAG
jgi:hypothetical protein